MPEGIKRELPVFEVVFVDALGFGSGSCVDRSAGRPVLSACLSEGVVGGQRRGLLANRMTSTGNDLILALVPAVTCYSSLQSRKNIPVEPRPGDGWVGGWSFFDVQLIPYAFEVRVTQQ